MKYLKWLNLIPLIMFFIVDKLRGTLISRYLLIIIVVLGVINMLIAKGMKEYCISSLMLVVSTVAGMILYTYYYYYFVSAGPETPVFVYCLRGTRSAQAVRKMKAMGYNNAKSIGGIAAYKGQIVQV